MSSLYEAANAGMSPEADFDRALKLYEAGDFDETARLCQQVVNQIPAHSGAWHVLSVIACDREDFEGSLACIEQAMRYDPGHPVIHFNHGNALMGLKRHEEAVAAYRRSIEINPGDLRVLSNLAVALKEFGEAGAAEEAENLLRRVVTLNPQSAEAHANLARFLRLLESGREHEAIDIFQQALALEPTASAIRNDLAELYEQMNLLDETAATLEAGFNVDPDYPELHLTAAKLERRRGNYEAAIRELEKMRAGRKHGKSDIENLYEYNMGQVCDAAGDSEAAFRHFTAANRLTRERWRPSADNVAALPNRVDRLKAMFSSDWVANWSKDTTAHDYRPPVFLIGMPRSGTTLLDTILGAHGGFDVLEERPTTIELLRALEQLPGNQSDDPEAILDDLGPQQFETLRTAYFDTVDRHLQRRDDTILLDKNPFNILNAGTIYRVMPDARFVLAVRHPCDVCLSCFMQNFTRAASTVHFFDLVDAARLYARIMDLWQHYIDLLPIRHHSIRYEDLIENPQNELRELLAFMDAPWSDTVLDHVDHALARGKIKTPSYHQVTQPIYQDAKYRWLKYRKQLEPALKILQPYVEYFGYPSL